MRAWAVCESNFCRLCDTSEVRAFPDGDLDGVGAGEPACVDAPLGPGWSLLDTDCSPNDLSAWTMRLLYSDADGDGVTIDTGAHDECVGLDAPAGWRIGRKAAPVVSFLAASATTLEDGDRNFSNEDRARLRDDREARTDNLTATDPSDTLVMTDFALGVPPVEVLGVEVRVRAFSSNGSGGGVFDRTVRLYMGGGLAGTDHSVAAPWPSSVTERVYGGPDDLWGLSLNAADLNLAGFGVGISVEGASGENAFELDNVTVRVFVADGAEDCAPDQGSSYSTRALYQDGDGDWHGSGGVTVQCVGAAQPQGWSPVSDDCDDADPRVYPDNSIRYPTPRDGGGFGYDCDGVDERQSFYTCTNCQPADGGCARSCAFATVSQCGQAGTQVSCAVTTCTTSTSPVTTGCR